MRVAATPWRRAGKLAVLASLLLLAGGCGAASAPATTSSDLPVLALPAALAGEHVFVTDLATGDLDELGVQTQHAAESVHGLGLSVDGHTLYVSDVAGNALLAYSLHNGRLGAPRRVRVGVSPVHMVQTLDERRIFVTNFGAASVSVIDVRAWRTTATIQVPAGPHGIALSPDGRWVYVACPTGGAVAVLDAASAQAVGTIVLPAGAQPYSVAVSHDGRYLYVPDNFAARLFVVEAATRQVVGEAPIGRRAALVALAADGATLYVTNGGSSSVSVLDLASDPVHPRVRATVQVGVYPHGLTVTPDGRYLIVANTYGKSLSVIATASDQVVATISAERYPNDVLAAP
jgi:YVTN family beta-propeller protein